MTLASKISLQEAAQVASTDSVVWLPRQHVLQTLCIPPEQRRRNEREIIYDQVMRDVPAIGQLKGEKLHYACRFVRYRRFSSGEYIFRRNSESTNVYLLWTGSAREVHYSDQCICSM